MKKYMKIEQNLYGVWVELMAPELKEDMTADEMHTMIKNIKSCDKCSFVYEDENGKDIAVAFNGEAGPLRMTIIEK